jgi:HSP20 family molecular chaperone IbpA
MAFRDLIPWNNRLSTTGEVYDPFVTFHREMNRLFDDVFRGFGNFGRRGAPMMEGQFGWPRIELNETDKAVTVSAELPGLSEKDVEVEIAGGVLSIRGEKRAEHDNGGKWYRPRRRRCETGQDSRETRRASVAGANSSHTENPQACLSKNYWFCRDSCHRYGYTG